MTLKKAINTGKKEIIYYIAIISKENINIIKLYIVIEI